MAFDVSALTNYVREKEGMFLTSIVFKPATASVIEQYGNVQVGVKSPEKINIIETDAIFQVGGTCGFNASGTTTFTQRTLTPGKIKVHEKICPKDLESRYTQKYLMAGSQYTEVDFADMWMGKKIARINAQLETAIWQGDTASGNANLARFDGLLKTVTADSASVINANTAPYGFASALTGGFAGATDANVIKAVDAVWKAIPTNIVDRDDLFAFCGWDVFRQYGVAVKNTNFFDASYRSGLAQGEVYIPNSTVKLKAVNGLNGTNKIVATWAGNLALGVDLLNEEDKFELFWAREADELRTMIEFKYAVNYAFPTDVVQFNAS
jgi:hypothetical protein